MIGIPLFYIQELRGFIAQFRDNFNDASLYWAWAKDETDSNRQVIESEGKLTISVKNNVRADWRVGDNFAPKVVMGAGAFPFEVITKMESVSLQTNTMAGLFIAGNPGGLGSNMMIVRKLTDTPWDGIVVYQNETTQKGTGVQVTDDPIFLRIRIGNYTYDRKKIIFSYSLNGISWVDVYTEEGQFSSTWSVGVGLFVSNDIKGQSLRNNISVKFDYFKTRSLTRNIN